MNERIRVMVVDDHLMVRRGLATFLRGARDLELVGEAATGAEAIRLCEQTQADVVLMDLRMPGLDGIAATRAIRQAYPHIQVIALTSSHEDELVAQALRAGAIGYLLKDVGVTGLGDAIRAAKAGRPTLAPEATQALVRQAAAPASPGDGLTQRERQVLALMVEGISNAQIAERLVLSRSTVNFHVGNVLGKLGAASRTQAVTVALQRRLIG
ncbi:MAG TPA: response regulator transcription factor [Chloroflexota bacterium]